MEKQTRSILAILSTDIAGYTQKTEEDESYAFSLVAKHRDIINKYVTSSNGFLFKEMGDGTFSKFDSAIDEGWVKVLMFVDVDLDFLNDYGFFIYMFSNAVRHIHSLNM